MAVTVRPAREADLPALARLAREHGGSEASPATLRERYRAHPDLFVVADADGRLVGEAHGRPRRPAEDPTGAAPPAVVLERIAVRPDRRGEGLGRRLLAAVEERAADRAAVAAVELAAAGTVEGFYRACGYEPWAVLVCAPDTDPTDALADDSDVRPLGERRVDGEAWWYLEPTAFASDAGERNDSDEPDDPETEPAEAVARRLADRLGAASANTLYRNRVD